MSNDTRTTAIALFVRVPIAGWVKTRLAAELGNRAACQLYQAMVADILASISASGLPLVLFHDEGDPNQLPASWTRKATKIHPQCQGDIGQRMAAAFGQCFGDGYAQVLLCGSDIPGIDTPLLIAAAHSLTDHDAVLLPTFDGGYGLIGLKRHRYHPAILSDIPWSSDQVLISTLARLNQLDYATMLLPPQRDIDTLDDLKHYQQAPSPAAVFTNQNLAALATAGILK